MMADLWRSVVLLTLLTVVVQGQNPKWNGVYNVTFGEIIEGEIALCVRGASIYGAYLSANLPIGFMTLKQVSQANDTVSATGLYWEVATRKNAPASWTSRVDLELTLHNSTQSSSMSGSFSGSRFRWLQSVTASLWNPSATDSQCLYNSQLNPNLTLQGAFADIGNFSSTDNTTLCTTNGLPSNTSTFGSFYYLTDPVTHRVVVGETYKWVAEPWRSVGWYSDPVSGNGSEVTFLSTDTTLTNVYYENDNGGEAIGGGQIDRKNRIGVAYAISSTTTDGKTNWRCSMTPAPTPEPPTQTPASGMSSGALAAIVVLVTGLVVLGVGYVRHRRSGSHSTVQYTPVRQ